MCQTIRTHLTPGRKPPRTSNLTLTYSHSDLFVPRLWRELPVAPRDTTVEHLSFLTRVHKLVGLKRLMSQGQFRVSWTGWSQVDVDDVAFCIPTEYFPLCLGGQIGGRDSRKSVGGSWSCNTLATRPPGRPLPLFCWTLIQPLEPKAVGGRKEIRKVDC